MGHKASKSLKEENSMHKSPKLNFININQIPYLILKQLSDTTLLIRNLNNEISSNSFILKIINVNNTVDLIQLNKHFDLLHKNISIMKILNYEKQVDKSWKLFLSIEEYPFNLFSYCHILKNPQQLHDILIKAVKALEDIHSRNIFHGNIKPTKILLGYELQSTVIELKFTETGLIYFENPESIQMDEYLHPDLREILAHSFIYQDFQLQKIYKKKWDLYALGMSFVATLLKMINSPVAIPNKELLIQFFSLIKKRVGIELIYDICDLLDIREETEYYMNNGSYLKQKSDEIKHNPENFMILDKILQEIDESLDVKDCNKIIIDKKGHTEYHSRDINPDKFDSVLEEKMSKSSKNNHYKLDKRLESSLEHQNIFDLEINSNSDDTMRSPLLFHTQENLSLYKTSKDDSKDLRLSNLLMNFSNNIGHLNINENSKLHDDLLGDVGNSKNFSIILDKSESPGIKNVQWNEKVENSELELSPICMVSPKVISFPINISELLKKKVANKIDKTDIKGKMDTEKKARSFFKKINAEEKENIGFKLNLVQDTLSNLDTDNQQNFMRNIIKPKILIDKTINNNIMNQLLNNKDNPLKGNYVSKYPSSKNFECKKIVFSKSKIGIPVQSYDNIPNKNINKSTYTDKTSHLNICHPKSCVKIGKNHKKNSLVVDAVSLIDAHSSSGTLTLTLTSGESGLNFTTSNNNMSIIKQEKDYQKRTYSPNNKISKTENKLRIQVSFAHNVDKNGETPKPNDIKLLNNDEYSPTLFGSGIYIPQSSLSQINHSIAVSGISTRCDTTLLKGSSAGSRNGINNDSKKIGQIDIMKKSSFALINSHSKHLDPLDTGSEAKAFLAKEY